MGEVVRFPTKNRRVARAGRSRTRGCAVDLDRKTQIAVMSVLIHSWQDIAQRLWEDDTAQVTLDGATIRITRNQALSRATTLIEERDSLLTNDGPAGDMRVMRECRAAFRAVQE